MNAQPFSFETEFDDAGGVVRHAAFRPIKRAFTPAEVEALVAQARLEAREQALAESASLQAMALSTIGQALGTAAPALAQVAEAHRAQSAELALAAARVIAAVALERMPRGPLQAALEALAQEIEASPRLIVRAAMDEQSQDHVRELCAAAGFHGLVAFRDEPGHAAAFTLEWADGRAAFDPEESAARVAQALRSALAADAGHAEALPNGSLA